MSSSMRATCSLAAAGAVVERDRRPGRLLRAHAPSRLRKNAMTSASARTGAGRPACVAPSTSERTRSGCAEGELLGDHAPQREAVDVHAIDAGASRTDDGVVGHRLGRVGVAERARASDAAAVERDHAQAAREHRHGAPPGAAAQSEAHDQQNGRRPRRCSPSAGACARRRPWPSPTRRSYVEDPARASRPGRLRHRASGRRTAATIERAGGRWTARAAVTCASAAERIAAS